MGQQKPKLLDRVRHEISPRHYSHRTEDAYVHWIKRFIERPGLTNASRRRREKRAAPDTRR